MTSTMTAPALVAHIAALHVEHDGVSAHPLGEYLDDVVVCSDGLSVLVRGARAEGGGRLIGCWTIEVGDATGGIPCVLHRYDLDARGLVEVAS